MKVLDFDPESGGRTWRNPVQLDRVIARSTHRQAAILISGKDLIASTGPVTEHVWLMCLAGIRYGEDRDTTDTQVDSARFCEADIGMLRGQATAAQLTIELELSARKERNSLLPPDVDPASLDLLITYVGRHPRVRVAWPKGVEVVVDLRPGPDFEDRWTYQGGIFKPHE